LLLVNHLDAVGIPLVSTGSTSDRSQVGQLQLVNMAEQVNVQDAKTRLSELLQRVEKGEEITIARAGKPIARLVAVHSPARRELGFVPGGPIPDSFWDPLPEDELRLWNGE
jgi:prevent-host-death family protein